MNTEKLFPEFQPVSTEEWEKKILEDLKGADYNKKLIWKSIEGVEVKPYYRQIPNPNYQIPDYKLQITNQIKHDTVLEIIQSTVGPQTSANSWEIRQDIYEDDPEQANMFALEAIGNGANAIGLKAKKVNNQKQLTALLKGIDLTKTGIHFTSSKSYPAIFDLLQAELKKKKTDISRVHMSFNFDPISYLLLHGNFYEDEKSNFAEASYLIKQQNQRMSRFFPITINGHYFHNSGASVVQELAFSLAAGHEYIVKLTEQGLPAEDVINSIMFSFAAGSNYFIEIAKLRAARILWGKITGEYLKNPKSEIGSQKSDKKVQTSDLRPQTSDSAGMFIHSYTSIYNNSIYDAHNNMLRCTTEAMSAAIGGADSVTVHPYNICFEKPNEFSYRIARNIQILLKSESYIDKVADASGGSYYIENLTDIIANAAWQLFKETEAKGGCIEAIKQNFIQNKIEETSEKRIELVADRKQTILGVNQYPNANESMLPQANKLQTSDLRPQTSDVICKTLKIHRGSEPLERIRLETENYQKKTGKRPKVFLLTIGNLAMRRARATFSANFFGCSGYEIIDNNGFCSVDEGVEAALKAKPDAVVICSSDEEYATVAPEIAKKIKAKAPKLILVLAGEPKNIINELKEAGIDEFISRTTNIQVSLMDYQYKLGVI